LKIVSLKISRFSKRIILHEYRHSIVNGVVVLCTDDELLYQLSCKHIEEKDFSTLNDILDVCIPSNRSVSDAVGMVLHKLHKRKMCHDVSIDGDIQKNLRAWLDKYGIEDEDFALETTVKIFYRFRKKKSENMSKSGTLQKPFVLPLCDNQITVTLEKGPLRISEVQILLNKIIDQNLPMLMTKRGQLHKRLIKQLHIYLLRQHYHCSPARVQLMTGVSRTSMYLSVRKFQLFLNANPRFKGF
jgi:hypothetical protein